ncbi:hypothetical protein ACWGID_21750 [Kribbella sp. NPDC054772]
MDMKCHVVEGVESAANGWIAEANRITADFFSTVLNSLSTFWVDPKTPIKLASTTDGQTWTNSQTVQFVHNNTLPLTLTIFALAIIAAGLRMAWEQRAKPLQELLKAMLIFVVVCGAGTAMVQVLVEWSDDFSVHLVKSAIGGESFSSAISNLVSGPDTRAGNAGINSIFLVILIGQLATWASLIQIVLMLIRSAMLVLLGATLPLAAAATNTEIGKTWFKKYCAWTLGFIAYKPAAALIYAAAIKLKDENMLGQDNGLTQALTALMMMMLAILALPALLRFAVPVTAAVAGGSAGMGSSPDFGGMATGALNVGGGFGGGGSRSGAASGGGSVGGGGGGAAGAAGGGGGATGAKLAGSAGGAALGPAGIAATAARKAAGAFAGAAAHSAGEAGGGGGSGSSRPSGAGPMGGRSGGSRSGGGAGGGRSMPTGRAASSTGSGGKTPAGAGVGGNSGPSGNW